jgi:hypothetical protein
MSMNNVPHGKAIISRIELINQLVRLSASSRGCNFLSLWVLVQLEQYGKESMTVFNQTDRHPELPSMRARRRAPIRARLWREWAERPNRGEGPFVLAGNTRSLRATRPLMKTRLAYALRDDALINGLNKRRNSNCTTTSLCSHFARNKNGAGSKSQRHDPWK